MSSFTPGIWSKRRQQALHRLAQRLLGSRSDCSSNLISRVLQTRGDASELAVRRTNILRHCFIHAQCSIHLWEQAAQVRCFFLVRKVMERLRNRIQLVIASQSSPNERFSATSVHCITNRAADVLFDGNQFRITRSWGKGRAASTSGGAGSERVSVSGTAAKAPSSSGRWERNCASTSSASLATAFKKCS